LLKAVGFLGDVKDDLADLVTGQAVL